MNVLLKCAGCGQTASATVAVKNNRLFALTHGQLVVALTDCQHSKPRTSPSRVQAWKDLMDKREVTPGVETISGPRAKKGKK